MIDGGFNGGRQSSCVGSTEPQVGIIDPVVIALFGFVGDPSKYQVVTNPVWRQLLLRLLVTPQVMAPLAVAVGISVVLIIITYQLRQTMMEAQLEDQVGEDERCKKSCSDEPYNKYWSCSQLQANWTEYQFATERALRNRLETITNCKGSSIYKVDPAETGPCSIDRQPPETQGTHILYYHQGKKLGSGFSCPCCRNLPDGPKLQKLYAIHNWEKSCR